MLKRTIDGRTLLIIEKERGSRRDEKQSQPQSYQQKSEIVLEKKWMDKEELNEKHLEAAIMNKERIPVPDIIEIDEEVYDKLYPANFKRNTWRIIAEPPNEKEFEYDMDGEDTHWLKDQPASYKLTPDKFEAFFEFLEENSKKKVPSFTDFHTAFKIHRPIQALEKVYDYWLDKRLKKDGKHLVPTLKKLDKKSAKKFDPYLAFRPCREKMFLRKNRQLDRENYMKMFRIREQMLASVRECKNFLIEKRSQHEQLKSKMNNFVRQYQQKDFSDPSNNYMPIMHYDEMSNSFNSINIGSNDDSEEPTFDSVRKLDFPRKPHQQFHKALKKFATVTDTQQFYATSLGLVRPRVGRGGRIIYDRPPKNFQNPTTMDYHQYTFINEVKVRRLENNSYERGSSSAFRLSSCLHGHIDDVENQFYFAVE